MSKITTIKGNLFDAPKGSIIIHAVNCRGLWGAGIAREFAKRFPEAYEMYSIVCQTNGNALLGKCLLIPVKDYTVGCLFTSKNYGQFVDKPAMILKSTRYAIEDLIKKNIENKPMHMCKINSGLFNVPWDDTKAVLEEFGVEFTIYDF